MKKLRYGMLVFTLIAGISCNSQINSVKINPENISKVIIESVGFPAEDIQFELYSNDSATTTLINLINESNLIDDASVRSFSKGKLLITVIASNDTIYCFNSPIYKQNSINLEIYSECYTGWYIGALSNKNFYSFFKDLFEVRYLVKFP